MKIATHRDLFRIMLAGQTVQDEDGCQYRLSDEGALVTRWSDDDESVPFNCQDNGNFGLAIEHDEPFHIVVPGSEDDGVEVDADFVDE